MSLHIQGSYKESENCLLLTPLTDYIRFPCSPQVTAEPWAGLWSQSTHAHKVPNKLWMCEFLQTIRSFQEVNTTDIRQRHVLKHAQMDCGVKSILCPLRSWKRTGRHWSRGASGYNLKRAWSSLTVLHWSLNLRRSQQKHGIWGKLEAYRVWVAEVIISAYIKVLNGMKISQQWGTSREQGGWDASTVKKNQTKTKQRNKERDKHV